MPEITLPSESDFPPSDTEAPDDDVADFEEEDETDSEAKTLLADYKVLANRIGAIRQPGGVLEKVDITKSREALGKINLILDVSTLQ